MKIKTTPSIALNTKPTNPIIGYPIIDVPWSVNIIRDEPTSIAAVIKAITILSIVFDRSWITLSISSYSRFTRILPSSTTSKKFKGLESNVVILVDFNSNIISTDELARLFYVSTSRARQLLDIFYYNMDNDIKLLGDKIEGEQNAYIKISKMFKVRINEID